jgi:hypothetical protein
VILAWQAEGGAIAPCVVVAGASHNAGDGFLLARAVHASRPIQLQQSTDVQVCHRKVYLVTNFAFDRPCEAKHVGRVGERRR